MAYATKSLDLELSSSQFAYIADASQTGLDFTSAITLEGWVNFQSLPADGAAMRFITKDDFGANRSYGFNFQDPAGATSYGLHFRWFITGTDGEARVGWTPSTATWYHVAVTRDATSGDVKFYVNGTQQGATQASTAGNLLNTAADFMVGAGGASGSPGNFMDGKMSLWRAWSVVRTQAQISGNYCSALGSTASLSGEWILNNAYTDNSGNANTITASGSPVFVNSIPTVCFSGGDTLTNSLISYG